MLHLRGAVREERETALTLGTWLMARLPDVIAAQTQRVAVLAGN